MKIALELCYHTRARPSQGHLLPILIQYDLLKVVKYGAQAGYR